MRHAPPLAGTGAPPSPAGVRFIHTHTHLSTHYVRCPLHTHTHTHISAHTMYGVRFYPTCSTMRRHLRPYPTCIHPHPKNPAIKTGDQCPTTPTFTGAETFHYPFLAPRAHLLPTHARSSSRQRCPAGPCAIRNGALLFDTVYELSDKSSILYEDVIPCCPTC
jgi:hypothetical protein